jgi:hypothetical protein
MISLSRTFAAITLTLLALISPAHAATIQWDLSGVTGEILPAVTVTGFFDYDTIAKSVTNYSFTVNGPALGQGGLGSFTFTPSNSYIQGNGGNTSSIGGGIYNDGTTVANLENLLLGTVPGSFDGTSGSPLPVNDGGVGRVTEIAVLVGNELLAPGSFVSTPLEGEFIEASVSAVPLPPTLPMFGAALFALAGFAAWSRRSARG